MSVRSEPTSTTAEEAFVEEGSRRDGDQDLPLGPRARQTRNSILVAAAAQFAENGYAGTTMADVAAAADVSLGTVYQYFRDRTDLIRVLVRSRVARRMNDTEVGWRATDGLPGLERLLTNFISAYAQVAPLASVWEEVTHIEPELAELRRQIGRSFTAAIERELRAAGKQKIVRNDLDAAIAARALTAMIDRFCFVTYVFDPSPAALDPIVAAKELALLWAYAIGLKH